jgi:hypothetical protein
MILGEIPQKTYDLIIKIVEGSPSQFKQRILSDQPKHFLKAILTKLGTLLLRFHYKKMIKNIPNPNDHYKQSEMFDGIPNEIRNMIIDSIKITHSYEFVVGSRTIRVHIILPLLFKSVETTDIKKYFRNTVRLIWLWFSIVGEHADCECGETTNIYLYLTQHYKKKPNQGPIQPIHANTAFTRTCAKNSTIQIFREEEWFKVLIHETFHSLGLDFSGMTEMNTTFKNTIQEIFHIKTDGLLYETYCETWATILNAVFVTAFMEGYPRTQPNISKIIQKIEKLLYLESKHALFQSSKVLQHMKITYNDFVSPMNNNAQSRLQKYHEETNVFCYYVLKSLLLFHLDDFLLWCGEHNKGYLNFNKTSENLQGFYDLIRRLYISDIYIQEHEYMETKYREQPQQSVECGTLRMTIFG